MTLPPLFTWIPMLHLPQVPEHFVLEARRACESKRFDPGTHESTYSSRIITRDGITMPSRIQEYAEMSPEWEIWCRDNIFPDFFHTTARISTGVSDTHGAHVDRPGKIRLYYLIDQGDATAETVFYMRPGGPVVHDPDNDPGSSPIHELDHDILIELDRVQFPVGQWILFNGYILHAVEKNSSARINLTVDIKPDFLRFLIGTV